MFLFVSSYRAVMPGMVMFRRRWSVGSDDLVLPALFLFILHCIWWVSNTVYIAVLFLFFVVFCCCFLGEGVHFLKSTNLSLPQVGSSVCGSIRTSIRLWPVLLCNSGWPWSWVPRHSGQLPHLWERHHVVEHERQHSVHTAQRSCAVCHLYTAR